MVTIVPTNPLSSSTTPINTSTNTSTPSGVSGASIVNNTPTQVSSDDLLKAEVTSGQTTTTQPVSTKTTTPVSTTSTPSSTTIPPTSNTTVPASTTTPPASSTPPVNSSTTTNPTDGSYNTQTGEGLYAQPSDPSKVSTQTAPAGYVIKYDSNDNPVIAPMNAADKQGALQSQMAQASQTFSTAVNNIENGTTPLNAGEQAQIDAIKDQFNGLIASQQLVNTNATGVANIRGYQSGAAEYDPSFAVKTIGSIVSAGQAKIASLQIQESAAIAKLTESLQTNDIGEIKTAYDALSTSQKDQASVLQNTITDAQTAIKDANDEANAKVTEQQNQQKIDEQAKKDAADEANQAATLKLDEISKKIELGTYNATYGAFLNPDGTPKTNVNVSDIPGYTSGANGVSFINGSALPAGVKQTNIGGLPVVPAADVPIVSSALQTSALLNKVQVEYNQLKGTINPTLNDQYNSDLQQLNNSLNALSATDASFSGLQGMSVSNTIHGVGAAMGAVGSLFGGNNTPNFSAVQSAINSGLSGKVPGIHTPKYGQVFSNPQSAQSYFTSTGQVDAYNTAIDNANTLAQQEFGRPANDGEILQVINQ